jgi:hypothetical protein
MLESVRDSLAVQTAGQGEGTGYTSAITILGVSLKWFIAGFISLLVIIFLLINGIKSFRRIIKQHREQYRNSELYYFRYFKKVSKRKDPVKAVEALYRWIDQLDLEDPTFQHFNSGNTIFFSFSVKAWSEARKNYLKGKPQTEGSGQILWINP